MMNAVILIIWVGIAIEFFVFGSGLLFKGFFVLGSIALTAGVWTLLSIKVIGPAEMAVFVFLGRPIGFRDSGPVFVPFLLARLAHFPKKLYNLDFPTRKALTMEGNYKGRDYGAQTIKVDSVVYIRFPRNDRLITILQSQVPTGDKELLDWAEEAVVGAIRSVVAGMTWRQAYEDIGSVRHKVKDIISSTDGALVIAGFEPNDVNINIKEIVLPSELESVMPEVERQRLEAEAAPFEAEQRAIETVGTVIRMMAEARGRPVPEIRQSIDTNDELQREFLNLAKDLITREMAIQGNQFSDTRIQVQGADGIERMILNALAALKRMPGGGVKPSTKKIKGKKKIKESPPVMMGGKILEEEEEEEEET